MDKQGGSPPSYEAAMANPIGFIPAQPSHNPQYPMPPHTENFKAPPYPTFNQSTPSGYIPPPAHATQVTQVVIQHTINYGHKSQPVTCPNCKHDIITRIEVEPSTQTHLCALLMCAFGIWPCCCIPYCVDSCQKVNHYCPNCAVYLGSFQN